MIKLKKLLQPYFLVYFLFFFINGALESFYPMYLEKLKFTGKEIGFAFTVINFSQIFLPTLTSTLTNKFKAKKVVTTGLLIILTFSLIIYNQKYLLGVVVLGIIIHMARPIFNFSLGNDILVSVDSEERGKYLSIRDLFLFGGMSIGIFAFSILVKNNGLRFSFNIWNLLYIVLIIYIVKHFQQNKHNEEIEEDSGKLKSVIKEKNLLVVIVINVLLTFSYACTKFVPILAMNIGFKIDEFMKYQSLFIIINALMAYKLADHFAKKNKRKVYLTDIAVDVLPFTLLALNLSKVGFIIAFLILQLKDIFSPVSFSYVMDLFEEKNITTVLGLLESINNCVGLIAPLFIGFLWDIIGIKIFYFATAITILTAVVAFIRLPIEEKNL